jgi:hypothetical protein
MAGSRPDASDKGDDGSDKGLKKPDAENLSRNITDSSLKESKDTKAEKKQPVKDVATTDDRSADKFLSQSTVQATLAAHVPAIGNIAKQDPNTAGTYPQWADWHADQNEKTGDVEAAEQMKEQGKKARAVIAKEQPKETSDKETTDQTTT